MSSPAGTPRCWLCGRDVVDLPGVMVRYRDARGTCHPWPDQRGHWSVEYLCSACTLLCPDWSDVDWSGAPDYLTLRPGPEGRPAQNVRRIPPWSRPRRRT